MANKPIVIISEEVTDLICKKILARIKELGPPNDETVKIIMDEMVEHLPEVINFPTKPHNDTIKMMTITFIELALK
jgi:hypothetical protein